MPKATYPPPSIAWNDQRIIQALGDNPTAIRQTLSDAGHPAPSVMAAYQWLSRGAVPHTWKPAVIYALMVANKISTTDLFRRVPAAAKTAPEPAE